MLFNVWKIKRLRNKRFDHSVCVAYETALVVGVDFKNDKKDNVV